MLDRLNILIGQEGIEKLKTTTVVVIGLGGVGGYAVESLVRSGIGKIVLIDYDTIDETNLNRQIITTKDNIGKKKVDEWEKRIKLISNIIVVKKDVFLTDDNINIILEEKPDFVLDACDTIKTKEAIIKTCLKEKINFICSMGTGNKMNPEKLEIIDINKTSYDPLAKKIRKFLKEEKINKKIMVVSSKEQPIVKGKVGSNSFVPATAGLLCSSYIINKVIK